MTPSKTFIKITNQMIYEKLEHIEECLGRDKAAIAWHNWAIGVLFALICLALGKSFF